MRQPAAALMGLCLLGGCASRLVWFGHDDDRARRVAVTEEFGGLQRAWIDEQPQPAFDTVAIETLAFGPSGELAYAARDERGWRVVLDAVLDPPREQIGELAWLSDGGLVYTAASKAQWHVWRHGGAAASGPFDAILSGSLRTRADGAVVFAAQRGSEVVVVRGSDIDPGYDGVAALQIDANRVVYAARRGDVHSVVVDGAAGVEVQGIGELVAAHNRVAYAAIVNDRWTAVIDDAVGEAHDRVDAVVISTAGETAYVARDGDSAVVVRGNIRHGPFVHVDLDSVRFGPAGRLAFAAWRRPPGAAIGVGDEVAGQMWLESEPGGAFEGLSEPVFGRADSPAEEGSWGYIGRRGDRSFVVVDDNVSEGYAWASDLVFGDGAHAYLARRGLHDMVVHVAPDGQQRRHAVPSAITGTLVVAGLHWGCLALSDAGVVLLLDGVVRPFDLAELGDKMRQTAGDSRNPALLRRWVAAELRGAR